jgi:hypothetical protein
LPDHLLVATSSSAEGRDRMVPALSFVCVRFKNGVAEYDN